MNLLSRRSAYIIVFIIIIILLVNFAWWLFYARTADNFESQLNNRLSALTVLGGSQITPRLIQSLTDGYLSAYDTTLFLLDNIQAADSLSEIFILDYNYRYLATTSLNADSFYYLTALNGHYIDSAFLLINDGHPIPPLVTDGYRVGDIVLKSAFIPLFDSSGVPQAVLGIEADVSYTGVLIDLKNNLYFSTFVSIGAGLLFGLFFFIYQRRMNAAEKSLFLSRSQANLGRMVAVVSHEIKNPLMIIRASAERLLKNDSESPEARFVIEEADRLNSILTGYLDFARGKRKVQIEKTSVGKFANKLVEQFGPRLAEDNVRLILNTDEENMAMADPIALRQVLINLVLNGAEAAKEQPIAEVEISHQTEGESVLIEVKDTGQGLKEEVMKSLFEPFYTTKTSGSGLGLFLSKQLIEDMQGSLTVASSPGGPTIFSVKLPKY